MNSEAFNNVFRSCTPKSSSLRSTLNANHRYSLDTCAADDNRNIEVKEVISRQAIYSIVTDLSHIAHAYKEL